MQSKLPEFFVQSLSSNGFSDLGLVAVSEKKLFRSVDLSKRHLKNKIYLRSQQQSSALVHGPDEGKSEFEGQVGGKEKVYACLPESIADQKTLLDFMRRTQPLLAESCNSQNDAEVLWKLSLKICDDLCLLRETPEGQCLTAASLCAPSGWSLASMLGKSIAVLHQPVPNLNQERGRSIDRLMSQLSSEKCFQRFNWGLKTTGSLALFPGRQQASPQSYDDIYLRIERQTLFRISVSTVAFAIDVTAEKLSAFCVKEPALLELLAKAYRRLSDEQLKYKGIAEFGEFL